MTESGDEGEVVVHDTEVSFLEPIYYKPFALLSQTQNYKEFYLPGEGNTVPWFTAYYIYRCFNFVLSLFELYFCSFYTFAHITHSQPLWHG